MKWMREIYGMSVDELKKSIRYEKIVIGFYIVFFMLSVLISILLLSESVLMFLCLGIYFGFFTVLLIILYLHKKLILYIKTNLEFKE